MSIGTKVGGGFCIVIALTMILGLWAIQSMRNGAEVSEAVAEDRLPRFIRWTEIQNDLLEGAYFAQEYFSSGSEDSINKTHDFLKQFQSGLDDIRRINSKSFYPNTAKAIEKADKDMKAYVKVINDDQELYLASESLVEKMLADANLALGTFKHLIASMAATQEDFINKGDAGAAKIYARNLAAANGIYAKIASLLDELLVAERNNDLSAFNEVERKLPQIKSEAAAIDKALLRDECHKMFAEMMKQYETFAASAANVAKTLKIFIEKGKERYKVFHDMYEDTIQMVNLTAENSNKYSKGAVAELIGSTKIVAVLLGIVLLCGVIVAVIITRGIVKPVTTTQKFAEEVAEGRLDSALDFHGTDELGKLADALRSMVGALKDNISEAREKSEAAQKATAMATEAMGKAEEAARQAENAKREGMLSAAAQLEKLVAFISSASRQLTDRIEQADKGASESAQRLQEAATAMNEMNATVQEVAGNAAAASQASEDTRQKALAGEHVVHNVVDSIANVQQTSLTLKEDMVQLNERAQDISRIMGVISDIADQTNLLALNAAIEAARAGEAGRGFAVVADEVRKLAEKTMTSTQDVSSAIHAIQESTGKSMRAVDAAVASIGDATNLAGQSGTALQEIVSRVDSTSAQMQAIAAASEEQSAASEEINRSISEVNEMSSLTADAMREAAMSVADLASQATHLNELIEQMKSA